MKVAANFEKFAATFISVRARCCSGYSVTTILPVFAPRIRSMNACGAFSRPSTMVSSH